MGSQICDDQARRNGAMSQVIDIRDSQSRLSRDGSSNKVELKQTITFWGTVDILIANIGGASVFIVPTSILGVAGSPGMALIVWALGGVLQAGLAFSAIEIALMFNKAGGPYYFINHTFGPLAGFVFMWGFVIFIASPMWALGAYTTSLYFLSLFYVDCLPSDGLVKLVASWVMVTLIAINCTYMKVIASVQKFLTICKVLALVIIVLTGLTRISSESGQENISHFMDGTNADLGRIALSLFAGYYAYGGWPIITILAEEVKSPERTVPRGLAFSFTVLTLGNVAANFSYYTVLSRQEALTSDAVAMLFGERVHPALSIVLAVLVCLCAIGTLNVAIMGQPRMLLAAGRNGHMPRFMTMLHTKFNTPWPATITMGCLAMIMLSTGTVMSLMTTISLYSGLMIFLLLMCFFTLRWKQPRSHRPWKVPLLIPVVGLVVTAILVVVSLVEKTQQLGIVLLVVSLGAPTYYVCVRLHRPVRFFNYIETVS